MALDRAVYMAIDQYGTAYHGLKFPRRDLLREFGRQHADVMYRDRADGTSFRAGYVIAGHWLEVFKVEPAFGEAM